MLDYWGKLTCRLLFQLTYSLIKYLSILFLYLTLKSIKFIDRNIYIKDSFLYINISFFILSRKTTYKNNIIFSNFLLKYIIDN